MSMLWLVIIGQFCVWGFECQSCGLSLLANFVCGALNVNLVVSHY